MLADRSQEPSTARYSCEEGWFDSLGDSLSWLLGAALIKGDSLGDELGILDIDGCIEG